MAQHTASLISTRTLALMGLACALGTTSCSDENTPEWWKDLWGSSSEKPAAEAQPVVVNNNNTEQKELLDYMIYSIAEKVRHEASNPAWHDDVRDMRNRLEEYYNSIEANGDNYQDTLRLGLFLANATRDLAAYQRALNLYNKTLSKWEAAPEEFRTGIEGRRMRSAIANGIGSCYFAQNKASEALSYYENALELDRALFEELAPADKAPLPQDDNISPELVNAAVEVLSSYRCLGECQLKAEDPEEARDTFKRGCELALRMKHLKPGMSIQYIRLLSALGDLEYSVGQLRQAYAAWTQAAGVAQKLQQVAPTAAIKVQATNYFRNLEAPIKNTAKELQEAQRAEQQQAESNAQPATEQ